jgi:hypothetical protein
MIFLSLLPAAMPLALWPPWECTTLPLCGPTNNFRLPTARDVHGAHLAADQQNRMERRRHDRRDFPAWPGAAGRRHQGEVGRGGRGEPDARHAPARNERDFDDIPKGARDALEFIWLERVDQAVEAALDPRRNESGPRPTSPPRDLGAAGRLGRRFRYEIGRRH